MNYKGDGGYEVVYPSVMVANIGDFQSYMQENYYNKSEAKEQFVSWENLGGQIQYTNATISGNQVIVYFANKPKIIWGFGTYDYGGNQTRGFGFSGNTYDPKTFYGYQLTDGSWTNGFNSFTLYADSLVAVWSPTWQMKECQCILFY